MPWNWVVWQCQVLLCFCSQYSTCLQEVAWCGWIHRKTVELARDGYGTACSQCRKLFRHCNGHCCNWPMRIEISVVKVFTWFTKLSRIKIQVWNFCQTLINSYHKLLALYKLFTCFVRIAPHKWIFWHCFIYLEILLQITLKHIYWKQSIWRSCVKKS